MRTNPDATTSNGRARFYEPMTCGGGGLSKARSCGGVHLTVWGRMAPLWLRDGPGFGSGDRTTSDEDIGKLINNRQNGRRRGRGGGQGASRPGGSNGGQDRGNRIDNRARGNAAQLLEKYKALARDAQMQGDRVNTEYYLQFADHYFRVLSESRSRFEEQPQQRPRRDDYVAQSDEDYGDEGDRAGNDERRRPQDDQPIFASRETGISRDFSDRPADGNGNRGDRDDAEEDRRPRRGRQPQDEAGSAPAEARVSAAEDFATLDDGQGEVQPRRRGRPPKQKPSEQIEVDRLPPSFSLQAQGEEGEPAEKPRRTRRPRGESAPV